MKIHTTNYTYRKFVNAAEVAKPAKGVFRHSVKSSVSFAGFNMNEALEKARKGWDAGIKELEIKNNLFSGVGTNIRPSFRGTRVNMGAYLKGDPRNMYKRVGYADYNRERVTVFVPLSYHGGIKVKQALKVAKVYIKIVNNLQINYDVKIVGVYYSKKHGKNDDEVINVNITLKEFDDRLVINNIAMAFHPAFFRRLIFKYREQYDFCAIASYAGSASEVSNLINDKLINENDRNIILKPVDDVYITNEDAIKRSCLHSKNKIDFKPINII